MTVQPVPAPDSTNELDNRRINDGGNSQKLILFKRGNAISTLFMFSIIFENRTIIHLKKNNFLRA